MLDIQGHILAINENGKCAMEIDDFSLVSGKLWKLLWPQQSHVDIDLALAAACRGDVGRFNAFCPTIKGISKWWEVLVTPVGKNDGSIASFFAISRDVTTQHYATVEREGLVRELQLANDRMIDIFNHAPAFMCALRGPAHIFEIVNDKYAALVGNRDLIGLPVRRALPELEGQGFFELLDAVYQTGEPFHGSNIPILLRQTPAHPLEEHVRDFVYMPLKEADGLITGVLVHGVNQTARSKAERALFESGDRYRKLVTQAGAGVVEADRNGIFTLVNQKFCDMLGYTEQELLGTRIIEVTAPSSIKNTQDAIDRQRRDGVPFVFDKQYSRKDGTVLWVTSSVSALHDPVGAYRGMVAIVVDISASRRVSEALSKS